MSSVSVYAKSSCATMQETGHAVSAIARLLRDDMVYRESLRAAPDHVPLCEPLSPFVLEGMLTALGLLGHRLTGEGERLEQVCGGQL